MKNLTSCVLSLYTVLVPWLFQFESGLEIATDTVAFAT